MVLQQLQDTLNSQTVLHVNICKHTFSGIYDAGKDRLHIWQACQDVCRGVLLMSVLWDQAITYSMPAPFSVLHMALQAIGCTPAAQGEMSSSIFRLHAPCTVTDT